MPGYGRGRQVVSEYWPCLSLYPCWRLWPPCTGCQRINGARFDDYIAQQGRPGDVVLLLPSYATIAFDYYNHSDIDRVGVQSNSVPQQLQTITQKVRRVWLVSHTADAGAATQQAQGWLQKHSRLLGERSFFHIDVRLYGP